MPGHGAVSRIGADAFGGPRGCLLHRSNTLMTIMRPPQQEHGGRKSSGSSGGWSSGGAATPSSSRARARLALWALPVLCLDSRHVPNQRQVGLDEIDDVLHLRSQLRGSL